jgi:ABC-type multidrug transport system fused ATPase/permease subunit
MVYPTLYKTVIDIMSEAPEPSAIVPRLITILISILILKLVNSCFWRLAGYTASKFQPIVMANVGKECFDTLHHHSYRFFSNNFSGAFVKKTNRIVKSFKGIIDLLTFEFYTIAIRISIATGNTPFSIYKKSRFDLPKVKADSKVTGQLSDTISNYKNASELRIESGQIQIDHQDISKVTQNSLRKNIALVPQDPILFHRTLMENIRYGQLDASDKAVIAASKMANCHEFIQKLPKKYKTLVGERGIKLSGGERQRIAIARAILSNAKILILDEAKSNLDSESESLIQEALKKLTKNKTTLIIAHHLSTIVHTDRILVLNKGEIQEEGTHHELIKRNESLYKEHWELQTKG